MGFLNIFKKKEEEEDKWVEIKPVEVKKQEEKPMIIKEEKPKLARMSKSELKKYFPDIEFE